MTARTCLLLKFISIFSLWFAVLYIFLYSHSLSDRTEVPIAKEDFSADDAWLVIQNIV